MGARIGVGLLGLGTVGGGVASILLSPDERHPLVHDLNLVSVAVRDLTRSRPVQLADDILEEDGRGLQPRLLKLTAEAKCSNEGLPSPVKRSYASEP